MIKNIFLLPLLLVIFSACNNVKTIQQTLYAGNYDKAINLSLDKIKKKKGKKSADPYIKLLKEAYDKALEKDEALINKLNHSENPDKWRQLYSLYLNMENRQERIKPVLPLSLIGTPTLIKFDFNDYTAQIQNARQHLADYLYNKAITLSKSSNKSEIRQAYDLLDELDRLNPGYKDVNHLMELVHQRGMTYTLVNIENQTDKIIPEKLQDELLNFSSYGANNFWVTYHKNKQQGQTYDYQVNLKFTQIKLSPDQEREKEIIEEKEIQDGYTYQKDAEGRIVKDSLGQPIKVPHMVKLRTKVYLYQQYKTAYVQALVEIKDRHNGQLVDQFRLKSDYVFDYHYATYSGDKRAIRQEYLDFLQKKRVPFPSSEQMIYDAAKDIKTQFKDILNKTNFL